MNTPKPTSGDDAALSNLMGAALGTQETSRPVPQDDTLARTGNTADHQAAWFAGMEQGQANAQHNAQARAQARDWKAIDAAVREYLDGYEMEGDGGYYIPNKRERAILDDAIAGMLADDEILELLAARPAPAASDAQIAAYTLPDGTRVEGATQSDGAYLWAVRRNGDCLGRDGHWSYEPQPSSRSQEWLALHRFPTAPAAIDAAIAAQRKRDA